MQPHHTQPMFMPNLHAIEAVDAIVSDAIAHRIFPGAVVCIAQHGRIVHAAAYGTTMYDAAGSQPVTRNTVYDIASVTKIITATAALRLYEQGVVLLDAPIATYLPTVRADGVTVRHLLTHTSGLSLRLSTLRKLPATDMRAAIYTPTALYPPGSHIAYVNINTLLLGDIVARVYGSSLDDALRHLVLEPLGMHTTCFCPPPTLLPRIAPTEIDAEWRGKLVHGHVHDDSTYALGGVAGHAGLFSTAHELWQFGQMWLDSDGHTVTHNEGETRPVLLQPSTVAMATSVQTHGCAMPTDGLALHCGMGWMMHHPVIMRDAPPTTYGHTGFTGPTLIVVPSHRLCIVIMSNRVYPQRTPMVHHHITAAIVQHMLST